MVMFKLLIILIPFGILGVVMVMLMKMSGIPIEAMSQLVLNYFGTKKGQLLGAIVLLVVLGLTIWRGERG